MRSALTGVSFLFPCPSLRALAIGAALALLGPNVEASEQLELPQLLSQADLVFEGTVTSIDYKNSEAVEPGDAVLPHTFVTFRIDDLVKGRSSAGASVTLRFLGGPDGTGRVLEVTELPRFSLGDRDVLFVRNEKSAICPVVGAENGRFRVVRGDLYDALGNEVWLAPDGKLLAGEPKLDVDSAGYPPRIAADDPMSAENAIEGADASPSTLPEGSLRPDAAGLKHLLRAEAAAQTAVGIAGGTEFRSARSDDVLRLPRFRAVVPRGASEAAKRAPSAPGAAKPSPRSDADRRANPEREDDVR